jgi:hypothetical protein
VLPFVGGRPAEPFPSEDVGDLAARYSSDVLPSFVNECPKLSRDDLHEEWFESDGAKRRHTFIEIDGQRRIATHRLSVIVIVLPQLVAGLPAALAIVTERNFAPRDQGEASFVPPKECDQAFLIPTGMKFDRLPFPGRLQTASKSPGHGGRLADRKLVPVR